MSTGTRRLGARAVKFQERSSRIVTSNDWTPSRRRRHAPWAQRCPPVVAGAFHKWVIEDKTVGKRPPSIGSASSSSDVAPYEAESCMLTGSHR